MTRQLGVNSIPVSPTIAVTLGLHEAIVLQQIHYWVQHNTKLGKHYHDGRCWTYNTYEQWQEQFPWWSRRTIQRIISDLRGAGLVLCGNYNRHKYDRTLWYTIDYDAFYKMFPALAGNITEEDGEEKEFVDYNEYIQSAKWKEKRNRRVAIDRYRCQKCGSTSKLNVHHLSYEHLGDEPMEDLITLCESCHAAVHGKAPINPSDSMPSRHTP